MRENPVISDRVRESGGSTEGTLGRWLAQRQAALRELLAAGARSTYFVSLPCRAAYLLSTSRATDRYHAKSKGDFQGEIASTLVQPEVVLITHRHLSLQGNGFRIVCVNRDGALRVLSCFSSITTLQKDLTQQNVSVN